MPRPEPGREQRSFRPLLLPDPCPTERLAAATQAPELRVRPTKALATLSLSAHAEGGKARPTPSTPAVNLAAT